VYVSVCVCVCMSFQLLSFKLSSGYLFSPHHVNQGVVQKPTPQVTLYESHTTEESLRRHRSDRNSQLMSDKSSCIISLVNIMSIFSLSAPVNNLSSLVTTWFSVSRMVGHCSYVRGATWFINDIKSRGVLVGTRKDL
jgi:hypothetical protein